MSSGWSLFIIIITVLNIIGALWLLWYYSTGRAKTGGSDNTTGHTWDDDLTEYNNPLPRWWIILFYLTVVFSVIYMVLYPGFGSYSGVLGWSQEKQYEEQVTAAENKYAVIFDGFMQKDIAALAQDEEALKTGSRIFNNNCSTCHGSDARGAIGFPNLTDEEWLYGDTPDAIKHSIAYGRSGVMPGWGAMLKDDGVNAVVAYVQQLSGQAFDADLARAGQKHYQAVCIACHGAEGKGNPVFGAPDLTNDIWQYGGDVVALTESIKNGRNGKMPAQQNLLNEAKIHVLTAYVYSLRQNQNE